MTKPLMAIRLYFFHMTGCPHCKMAEPDVARFQKTHPRVSVIRTQSDNIDGFEPAGTPAYLLKINEKQAFSHVGRLTLKELEKEFDEAVAEYQDAEDMGLEDSEEDESGETSEEMSDEEE